MNKSMRLVRIAMISAIGIASYVLCLKLFCHLTVITQYDFVIDPHFAPLVQASIRDKIQSATGSTLSEHRTILESLQTTFPSIAYSSLHLYAPRKARITVSCQAAALVVNDALAVTAHGHAFACNQLEASYEATCARMSVNDYNPQDQNYNSLLAAWIQKVPQDLRANYTIAWIDETTIYFTSTLDPLFKCVCSSECPPTTHVMATSCQLKESIKQSARIRNHTWIADVRFSHQIILYTEKSGGSYG